MDQVDNKTATFLAAVDNAAWADVARRRRGADLEHSIKSLAKEFAQTAMQSVDDRRQRQESRTEVYNAMVPLLREIGERHVDVRRGARYSVFGLGVGLLAVSVVLGVVIF